jgi:hypothetical protein
MRGFEKFCYPSYVPMRFFAAATRLSLPETAHVFSWVIFFKFKKSCDRLLIGIISCQATASWAGL